MCDISPELDSTVTELTFGRRALVCSDFPSDLCCMSKEWEGSWTCVVLQMNVLGQLDTSLVTIMDQSSPADRVRIPA